MKSRERAIEAIAAAFDDTTAIGSIDLAKVALRALEVSMGMSEEWAVEDGFVHNTPHGMFPYRSFDNERAAREYRRNDPIRARLVLDWVDER